MVKGMESACFLPPPSVTPTSDNSPPFPFGKVPRFCFHRRNLFSKICSDSSLFPQCCHHPLPQPLLLPALSTQQQSDFFVVICFIRVSFFTEI